MDTLPDDLLILACNLTTACESEYLYLHTNNKLFDCQLPTIIDVVRNLDWRWINHYRSLDTNNHYHKKLFELAGSMRKQEIIDISKPSEQKSILIGYAIGGHVDEFKLLIGNCTSYETIAWCCVHALEQNQYDIMVLCANAINQDSIGLFVSNMLGVIDDSTKITSIKYIHSLIGRPSERHIAAWAVRNDRLDVVKYLLNTDNPDITMIVLDYAINHNHLKIFTLCMLYGVSSNYLDSMIKKMIRLHRPDMIDYMIDSRIISRSYIQMFYREMQEQDDMWY